MLKRTAVRQRFFDLFESYECLDCRIRWERIVFTEDKHPTRYVWKLKTPAIKPEPLMRPAPYTELQNALAAWITPLYEEPAQAERLRLPALECRHE